MPFKERAVTLGLDTRLPAEFCMAGLRVAVIAGVVFLHGAPLALGQGLPAPWGQYDVGAVGLSGPESAEAGTFIVTGSGTDKWGFNDQFHFATWNCRMTATWRRASPASMRCRRGRRLALSGTTTSAQRWLRGSDLDRCRRPTHDLQRPRSERQQVLFRRDHATVTQVVVPMSGPAPAIPSTAA